MDTIIKTMAVTVNLPILVATAMTFLRKEEKKDLRGVSCYVFFAVLTLITTVFY